LKISIIAISIPSVIAAIIFYAFRLPRCVVIIGVTDSASGR